MSSAKASELADYLHREVPWDTLLNGYCLPTLHVWSSLGADVVPTGSHSPSALKKGIAAIELLEPVKPYELGLPTLYWVLNVTMCPVDARGEAYLDYNRPSAATRISCPPSIWLL